MDLQNLLDTLKIGDKSVGLGGCHTSKPYPCCEYNITVLDDQKNDFVTEFDGELIRVQHTSKSESRPHVLIQLDGMQAISDESWDLTMLLSKVREKKSRYFSSFAKDSLVESLFCCGKADEKLSELDQFAGCWIKCAAFLITDAICGLNKKRPSPSHMLETLRSLPKNKINENLSIVSDCIGIERASQPSLSRMSKSTMGFSDMVEKNDHSKIIERKHNFMVKNSLLADCYFYLGYINKQNMLSIKGNLHRNPELIHILKVAFDIENDPIQLEQQSKKLRNASKAILGIINK